MLTSQIGTAPKPITKSHGTFESLLTSQIGTAPKPDKVRDTDGTLRQLKLMSEVTGIKTIAGAGASKKIRDVKRLCKKYGGSSLKWRKMRGTAIIDDGGIDYKVELHWYNKVGGIRVYEVKIKRYLY